MSLQQFQTITFHRVFVDITGSINAALMLSNAIYWTNRLPKEREGWFYKTREEWQSETGLTRHEQDKARQRLVDLGILETRRAKISEEGITAIWFRIDQKILSTHLDQLPQTGKCQLPQTGKTNCRKPAIDSLYTSTTTSPSPPPRGRAEGKIPMSPTWTPSDSTYKTLQEYGIESDLADQCLSEFRLYWEKRGDVRDNWESIFVRNVRAEAAYRKQQEENQNGRSTASQGSSRQSSRGSRESLYERLERYERFITAGNDASEPPKNAFSGEFIQH